MMKSVLVATATVFLGAHAVIADPILIGAGKDGGGYDKAAHQLCDELIGANIACEVKNFDGSEEIVKAIENRSIQYGWSQSDVPFLLGVTPQLTALGFEEVGVLACSESSGIDELSDLESGHKVVVGPIGSGGALSWDGIVRSENDGAWSPSSWTEITPLYSDLKDGVYEVYEGTADCIFAVARPGSQTFKDWIETGLQFVNINDGDIDDLQRNDQSVYEVDQREALKGYWVDVLVLPASLYRSADAEQKSEEALSILRRAARSVR